MTDPSFKDSIKNNVPKGNQLIKGLVTSIYNRRKRAFFAQDTIGHLFLLGVNKQTKLSGIEKMDQDWIIQVCTSLIEVF